MWSVWCVCQWPAVWSVCYCVLQCVTVCSSGLQCVLCVLQCVAVACSVGTFYEAASGACRACRVCYSVLLHVTVCDSACYSGLQRGHVLRGGQWLVQGVPGVLQCVTACYSVLQRVTVACSALGVFQCVTVCYSVLPRVTVACSVGTFYEDASGTCRACRAGSYQNREGKLRCKTCGTDALTGPPGAASRKQCTGEGGGSGGGEGGEG